MPLPDDVRRSLLTTAGRLGQELDRVEGVARGLPFTGSAVADQLTIIYSALQSLTKMVELLVQADGLEPYEQVSDAVE